MANLTRGPDPCRLARQVKQVGGSTEETPSSLILPDPCRLVRQVKQVGWLRAGSDPAFSLRSSGPNSFTGRTSRPGSRLGAPLGLALGTGSPAGPAGRGQVGLVLKLSLPPQFF